MSISPSPREIARRNALGDLLRRAAARDGGAPALVHRDTRLTFAELDDRVDSVAAALADHGVAQFDRVALLSHNSAEFVVMTFALARLGAVCVPVNFMLTGREVAYVLDHSGASAFVVESALVPVADEALDRADVDVPLRCVLDGDAPEGWTSTQGWADHAAPGAVEPRSTEQPPAIHEPHIADDDPLQLMYTSGTESRPKGVMMTSRSLVAQYTSCIVEGRFARDDVVAHALPLFHVAAQHCFLMPYLSLGATNIVLDGPEPGALLEAIEREGVTSLFCPPTVWIALLRHPDFDTRDLSSLRRGYYGAAIMPVEVLHELAERLPAVDLFNFYGQTEMSAVALVLGPEDQLTKAGSAGRAAFNVETRLVDADGVEVPPGTRGEIVHRSAQATRGYWNDEATTETAFRDGWFHSGDLGVADEDGFITIVDRVKDMIKTGGENVASREVEEVLYAHPAVAEAVVFGVPHPRWIETVAAVVTLRPGMTTDAEALRAHCRERLAGFKTPTIIDVVDALPKNASGKILKRDLRATRSAEGGA